MLDRAYGQLGRDQPTDDFMAPRHPAPADPHHPSTDQHLWTPGGGPTPTPRPDPSSGGWRNYP
jgi:hypothetical protein